MPNKPHRQYSAIAVLILFLFSCAPQAGPHDNEAMQALQQWLDSERTTPAELITEEIVSGRPPVLIQDDLLRADTVDLMRSLVPIIHDLGISSIGVFFLDEADQDDIDRYIVSGGELAESEEFLATANASLGYREYRDFIEYVREFNQQGSGENGDMKLVALSRKQTLMDEESENLFLWLTADQIDGLPSTSEGSKAIRIHHYGPVAGDLRWNGLVEKAGTRRDIRDTTFAFRPTEVAWAKPDDFPGVDIVVVTSFPYRTVEPIANFVTLETAENAMKFFPDLRLRQPRRIAVSRMNGIIRRSARRHARELDRLAKQTES